MFNFSALPSLQWMHEKNLKSDYSRTLGLAIMDRFRTKEKSKKNIRHRIKKGQVRARNTGA